MPFKRPAPPRQTSSDYSSQSDSAADAESSPSKRAKFNKSAKVLPHIKLYIVQAKLDGPALAELLALAERNCEQLCKHVEDADVIVTSITMRKRFERHVPWEVAVSSVLSS